MKTKQLLFLCVAVLMIATNLFAKDIYVKTTGLNTNDGASWATAVTLDAALAIADEATNDVIHIAAGTYVPSVFVTADSTGLLDVDKTFEIKKNISLIGGYPADATTGALSDPVTNPTILNGDLGGGVKVYHTMVITAPKVPGKKVSVAGLVIKNGNSSNANTGSVTSSINNASIAQDIAGGVYILDANVELTDCEIVDNNSRMGSGITSVLFSNTTLRRCKVERNSTTGNGAGIYVEGVRESEDVATFYVYDSSISANIGAGTAAGLYSIYQCGIYVHNSTISNNVSTNAGAGIYVREGTRGYIVNSTIYGNISGPGATSGVKRAGLLVYGTSSVSTSFDVINTTITANSGRTLGGYGALQYCTSNIYNSVISGNDVASTAEFAIGKSGATCTINKSIVTDKVYDNAGAIVSGITFDSTTIGDLVNNGGYTKTCLISVAGSNPAQTGFGMTEAELTTLAGTFTPAISVDIITKDQVGTSRSGQTAMGALVDSSLISNVPAIDNISFKVLSKTGLISVIPVTASHLTVYTISGVKLYDNQISTQVDVKLPSGIYIVKLGDEVTRALVR